MRQIGAYVFLALALALLAPLAGAQTWEAWRPPESLTDLIDVGDLQARGLEPILTLEAMDTPSLRTVELATPPWSGSSWAMARGLLGDRYASPGFVRAAGDWSSAYRYVSQHSRLADLAHDASALDSLSPSEKYDLLIGRPGVDEPVLGALTSSMWDQGQSHLDRNGRIESWNGICHGWAPASVFVARPRRAVPAVTVEGKALRFYPDDLKALAAYLWSRNEEPIRMLGNRCDNPNPRRDPRTGRVLDEECFDVNPGLWHLALVNQLGVARRAFLIDANGGAPISNQPVFAYSYSFFNPATGVSGRLDDSRVSTAMFKNDRYRAYRSSAAAEIVGVRATIKTTWTRPPDHHEVDQPGLDLVRSYSYEYDLELDREGRIIGGEWHQDSHPDFVWTPGLGTHPTSQAENDSPPPGSWTPASPLPAFWREIAIRAAENDGEPLAAIVDALISESNPYGN